MAKYSVIVDRFDGGLNTKVSPLNMEPNESPDSQNIIYDDLGAIETRLGRELFTSAGIASACIDMLHSYFKDDGTKELLTVLNSNLYRFSGNTAIAVASALSIYTAGVRVQAVNYQNQMWLSNGGAKPYKWNGTEFTQWGIPVVSAPSASANGGGGDLSGIYKWVVVGVNSSLARGDYGSESTEITTIVSDSVYMTDIPVFAVSAGVNSKLICRNTANASGVFYVVTEISNAQTALTDDHADSLLVTLAPIDNGVPPYFTTIATHQGRMWGASNTSSNPTYLHFSLLNTPEVFPSENFLRIGDGDGYPIISIALLSNHIIVGKNDGKGNGSTWLVFLPDANPINWTVTKLDTESGGQSTNVLVKFNNYLAYLNAQGVYDINEFAVGDIKSDALSFNIEPDIFSLSSSFISESFAITWKNKVWFSVPYGESGGAPVEKNNRVYQYDYVRGRGGTDRLLGSWSRFSNINISTFAIHSGELYGGSSSADGLIYKLDTGRSDAGTAIDSYYKSPSLSGLEEHVNHTKIWRFAFITVSAPGDWYLSVEVLKDTELEGVETLVSLDPGGALYGTAILDSAFWGPGVQRKRIRIGFENIVSKSIQLKFATNAVNQYFKIEKLEVFYNLRGLRGSDIVS